MTLRAVLALSLLSVLPSLALTPSASALSCVRPDLIADLNMAKDSEDVYYIFVGTLEAPQIERPEPEYALRQFHENAELSVSGTFTGVSLTSKPGDDIILDQFPVSVSTSCMGPWCGFVPSFKGEAIAFVKVQEEGPPVLEVAPCRSLTHVATPENVDKIRSCLDRTCLPDITRF